MRATARNILWTVLCLPLLGLAQSTIWFQNTSATLVRDLAGLPIGSNGAQVQFAWAYLGTPYTPWTPAMSATEWMAANPGWATLGTPATVGAFVGNPGRFSGGTLTAVVFPPGAVLQAVVVGWSGNGAADYLAGYTMASQQPYTTSSGLFAVTPMFTVNGGDPTREPAEAAGSIVSSTATPFTGLTLERVPEPSALISLLGGSAVLILWRQSRRTCPTAGTSRVDPSRE